MMRKHVFVYAKKGADQLHGNNAADKCLFVLNRQTLYKPYLEKTRFSHMQISYRTGQLISTFYIC